MRQRLTQLGRLALADWAVLFLGLMLLVSLRVSPLPRRTLLAALPVVGGIVIYLLLAHWPRLRPHWDWLWWGLIAFGGLLCLVAPPAMLPVEHPLFLWLPFWGRLRDLLGDTFNPNVIAGAVAILLPFGLAKILALSRSSTAAGRIAALGAGLISLAMFALLALTWSRAAYLALFIALWLMGALCRPRVLMPITLLALAGIGIGGSLLGWDSVAQAFEDGFILGGWGKRLAIWSRVLCLIARFPLTGVGLDCFAPATAALCPLPRWAQGHITHAHNLYLQVALDLGLPGLAAYLVVLASSMQQALAAQRLFRMARRRPAALLAAACVASLTGLLVHGLLDVALWGNKGSFLPWMVMGVSMLLAHVAQEIKTAPSLSETEPGAS